MDHVAAATSEEVNHVGVCYNTHWLTTVWSTQAKVEGIVPRAAWHWVRDRNVVNDPLGEPGCTPLFVGLPSAWGSWKVTIFLKDGSILGPLADIHE